MNDKEALQYSVKLESVFPKKSIKSFNEIFRLRLIKTLAYKATKLSLEELVKK